LLKESILLNCGSHARQDVIERAVGSVGFLPSNGRSGIKKFVRALLQRIGRLVLGPQRCLNQGIQNSDDEKEACLTFETAPQQESLVALSLLLLDRSRGFGNILQLHGANEDSMQSTPAADEAKEPANATKSPSPRFEAFVNWIGG